MPKPVIGINSMLIGLRPIEEVYEIAENTRSLIPTYIDLRSRRNADTDPNNIWNIAHTNSAFDITNNTSVNEVLKLYRKYKKPLIAVSLYCGACYEQDASYGLKAVENAARLAEISLDNTLILRFLGGIANTIEQKEASIVTMRSWLECAQSLYDKAKYRVIAAIEVHQGQWPETLKEALEFKELFTSNIPKPLHQFFGFIEDPANRYIALGNSKKYDRDNENIAKLASDISYCHIKNVRKLGNTKTKHKSFQKVGIKTFDFDKYSFRWSDNLNCGDIKLDDIILDIISRSPKTIIGFSTEHVPATKSFKEAVITLHNYLSYMNNLLAYDYAGVA